MVFIKKIVMQGFLSYKNETTFSDFDQQVNVIVGRNGSGKSNIVNAIRFILSDQYSNFGKEDRKKILHQGEDTVMSSFVEIHFDNTERRFPVDKDEVVLRRTIGVKKDEYFLDKKHVQKSEVISFLEHAGFSHSNRYFIVEQEKVKDIASMKEELRYEIIKEVAGVRLYDERRAESDKLLQESETKKSKIIETLTYIEERLSELEQERQELLLYQELDKKRRALEYSIHASNLSKANEGLAALENKRSEASEETNRLFEAVDKVKAELRTHEKELKSVSLNVQQLESEREALEKEREEYLKQKTQLEFSLQDLELALANQRKENEKYKSEMKIVLSEIETTENQLKQAKEDYEQSFQEDQRNKESLMDAERRLKELYSKQGRTAQFKTKQERDKFLNKEIEQISRQINSQQEQIDSLTKDKSTLEESINRLSGEIEQIRPSFEEKQKKMEQINQQLNEKKQARDRLSNRRKELWRDENEKDKNIQISKEELSKCEQQLQGSVSRIISSGLQAVKRIAAKNKMSGVYGPIIELFDCPNHLITAVEITAGNSLFHIVVDTDDTAARILEELNKENGGRVTFMPLNKLNFKTPAMPTTEDAQPMLDELKFKTTFKKAFQQVFGKTLICRDLEIASQFAREYNLDCITIEGDQVNRKGALTGGFHDARTSRLETMKNIRKWRNQLQTETRAWEKMKNEINETDQEITNILGEIQALEAQRDALHDSYDQVSLDVRTKQRELQNLKEALEKKEQVLASLNMTLRQLRETKNSLENELKSAFLSNLTNAEQRELQDLTQTIERLKQILLQSAQTVANNQTTKSNLENQLYSNLVKRKEELEQLLNPLQENQQNIDHSETKAGLKSIQNNINEIEKQLEDTNSNIGKYKAKILELKDKIDKIKQNEEQSNKSLQTESESMEKLLNQHSLLQQKKQEAERKIREIGTLPTNEYEQFKDKPSKELAKLLQETQASLKEYSHVNKKAFDQYKYFIERRDELNSRTKELDEAKQSIQALIKHLDNQKEDTLKLTIQNVGYRFAEVFKELTDGEGTGSIFYSGNPEKPGLALTVKFSDTDREHRLTEGQTSLSHGQRSLVALAFIFAIQRMDVSPFYIFDEIDAALDTKYAHNIAEYIKNASDSFNPVTKKKEKTQFIVISFKSEIPKIANKHYLVKLIGKASSISPITKEEALAFIEETHQTTIDDQMESEDS